MKKTIIAAVLVVSLFVTSCGSTAESEPSAASDTSAATEESTTTEATTTEATTTEAATLDMTIDEVVETVFKESGLELADGKTTIDEHSDKWYIDPGLMYIQSFTDDGVIGNVFCAREIIFSRENPFFSRSLQFRIVEFNTESELYKNLKVGDELNLKWQSTDDPSYSYDLKAVVGAINKQFAICVIDYYDYVPGAEPGKDVSEKYLAPFETEDLQLLYDAFVGLGQA